MELGSRIVLLSSYGRVSGRLEGVDEDEVFADRDEWAGADGEVSGKSRRDFSESRPEGEVRRNVG